MTTSKILSVFLLCAALQLRVGAQDTFSIVAVDSITGEVGSAGASCVDLFNTSLPNDDFIGVLLPGKGAINTQAYYLPANQDNATSRMNEGDTPEEIIEWLTKNDVEGRPERRQYGIASLNGGSALAASYTGSSTDGYKGHNVGPYYAIQGNILLGKEILDSMESKFLNARGDLACRLMAALQGANVVGADSRCASNGTSSLFAYVKVAQKEDDKSDPSFLLSVRTRDNSGIEPIDSLQTLFDAAKGCWGLGYDERSVQNMIARVYPNPAQDRVYVRDAPLGASYRLVNSVGATILEGRVMNEEGVSVNSLPAGLYFMELFTGRGKAVEKLLVR